MARLTIEQVAAPDFSSTSQILANAGKAFDSGLESAKGLLGKYQEGQMLKADNLILNDIAKLGSEEELNAYLNSDALQGKNFSPKMQETILGLRKGVLGYGQDRANIDSTTSATGRLNAAEGRTAAEYTDGVNARSELRGLTGAVVDATEEGRRYGQGGSTGGSTGISGDNPVFSGFMGTVQQIVKNPYALAAIAATGSHESGFSSKNAAGSWSDPSESGRPGTAGGVMSWNNDRFENMRNFTGGDLSGEAQAKFFLQEDPQLIAALNNAKSAEEATQLMNNAWRFAGYDRQGGEASARIETAKGLVGMFSDGSVPVTQNPGSGRAASALADAIKGSVFLTPDQALGMLQTGYDAQTVGQGNIDTAEKKRVDEAIAAGTLSAIQDPGNLTGTAVQQDMLRLPGQLPAAALLAGAENAGNLAFGSMAGVVAPATAADPLVTAALGASADAEANNAAKDPSFAAVQAADEFQATGDVAQALIESTGGLAEGSGMDKNYVQTQVERIAETSGVTIPQAAATLADMTKAGIPLTDMLIGNDPDMDAQITKRAQTLYSDEALKVAADKKFELQKSSDSRAKAELVLSTAQTKAAKLPEGSPERVAAEAEIANLKDSLLVGKTPQEVDQLFKDYVTEKGMLTRLKDLSPGDADFTRAMMQLEEEIVRDKGLSPGEKELLIKKVRG